MGTKSLDLLLLNSRAFSRSELELIREVAEENRRLRKRVDELSAELEQLAERHELAQKEIDQLKERLEKQRRAGKRQAAPFSKGSAKKDPKKPGRKAGAKYGPKAHRPPPSEIREEHEAALPPDCPECQGPVRETRVALQFQVDLPEIDPITRQFNVHIGECTQPACGVRVQGRHPLQTSDALGAAASQLGPNALALLAKLKVEMGLSYGKVVQLLQENFGIAVTAGGACQALQRMGRHLHPTYEAFKACVRAAGCVSPDETGWRVSATSAWLWVFATSTITVYSIEAGRGFLQAAKVLGENFSGILCRDGWHSYRSFKMALHQTCYNHLLRRCSEILETAQGEAALFPQEIKKLLKKALRLRDRWQLGDLSARGLAVARGRLEAAMDRLLDQDQDNEENRKFSNHLGKEQSALFTFLYNLGIAATNYLAEQELRPLIATRKTCGGGNRSWKGALALQRIGSVLRTARRQDQDSRSIIVSILRSPKPTVATVLLPLEGTSNLARPPPD